jgi:WhiB family redox-sensing transcriptional regulator
VSTATFFVTSTDRARLICSTCPVRAECLAAALDGNERGVWGGLAEHERRRR